MLLIAFSSKEVYKRVYLKDVPPSPRLSRVRLRKTTNHVQHLFPKLKFPRSNQSNYFVGQTSGWPCENLFIFDNEHCVYCTVWCRLCFVFVFFSNTIAWLINIDHFSVPQSFPSFFFSSLSKRSLKNPDSSSVISLGLSFSLSHTLARVSSFLPSNLHALLLFRAVLFISMREKSSMWLTSGLYL